MLTEIKNIVKSVLSKTELMAKPIDTELGLHPDGGSWGFYPGKVIIPELYNILLIGDSIMNGYRHHIIKNLRGKANIDCWLTPAHLNSQALNDNLKKILSFKKYDLIHFNIGLHGWLENRVLDEEYPELLNKYVFTLKQECPHAKIIWASITQIFEKGTGELNNEANSIIVRRNQIATGIMKNNNIKINDLYGLMSDKLDLCRGDMYHWKKIAYEIMARQSLQMINDSLLF